jgi:hypothetical protein
VFPTPALSNLPELDLPVFNRLWSVLARRYNDRRGYDLERRGHLRSQGAPVDPAQEARVRHALSKGMSYRTASEAAGVSLGKYARAWRPALLAMWWTFQPIGFGGSSFSAMRQVSTAT